MNMPLRIAGHNMELTDTLKDYVSNKFQKLEKHFANIVDINVTLSVERVNHKMQHKAKAHIVLPKKNVIVAEETSDDMYASIDLVLDKLDRQIKEYNRQMKDE